MLKDCPTCLRLAEALNYYERTGVRGLHNMVRNSLRHHLEKKHGISNPDIGRLKPLREMPE